MKLCSTLTLWNALELLGCKLKWAQRNVAQISFEQRKLRVLELTVELISNSALARWTS
ncbi:hypothetical protein PR002_g563 [Phytophthora rubi]|uniref:Uncharacterized protein n=1 Tax=Phytophthora rubi TaxID=129364 RepID=A0A6A3P3T1_9STRA|nr:hypothetical protein PR002_g563 [Phytophthora rubi]